MKPMNIPYAIHPNVINTFSINSQLIFILTLPHKYKLKLILLLVTFNLSYVSYSSVFCNVIGAGSKENLERAEKDPSKKRTCTFSKIGKKLFGESSKVLGIVLDMGINGNRTVSKKTKTKTKTKKGKNLKTDIEKISSTETTKEPKGKNEKQI